MPRLHPRKNHSLALALSSGFGGDCDGAPVATGTRLPASRSRIEIERRWRKPKPPSRPVQALDRPGVELEPPTRSRVRTLLYHPALEVRADPVFQQVLAAPALLGDLD